MGDMVHIRHALLPTALATLLAATPALARNELKPQPSNIVVHLFGPDSVTSHILPTGPAHPAPAGNSPTAPGQPAAAGTASQPASDAPTMTWGEIAHNMFVTGDPSTQGAAVLPKGRSSEH